MILKIKITSATDGEHSLKLTGFQYPIRLAFAMTLNKQQGQC